MKHELTVLLAEDDDGHAELVREYLRDGGLAAPVVRFAHGAALLEYLYERDVSGSRAGPFIAIIDIRMPVLGGVETLRALKADETLRVIPVIILTTTDSPLEIDECYRLGCSCYVSKPLDPQQFSETLRRIGAFIMVMSAARTAA